jgi:hypothetical protein
MKKKGQLAPLIVPAKLRLHTKMICNKAGHLHGASSVPISGATSTADLHQWEHGRTSLEALSDTTLMITSILHLFKPKITL